MNIQNEIQQHLAASKAKAEKRALESAQYQKKQAEALAFFEALKRDTILPQIEAAVAALIQGEVDASFTQGEQIDKPNSAPEHAFVSLNIAGEALRFEWIGHKQKVRISASRAYNEAGIPINNPEAYVAPLEVTPKLVNSYIMATVKLVT